MQIIENRLWNVVYLTEINERISQYENNQILKQNYERQLSDLENSFEIQRINYNTVGCNNLNIYSFVSFLIVIRTIENHEFWLKHVSTFTKSVVQENSLFPLLKYF